MAPPLRRLSWWSQRCLQVYHKLRTPLPIESWSTSLGFPQKRSESRNRVKLPRLPRSKLSLNSYAAAVSLYCNAAQRPSQTYWMATSTHWRTHRYSSFASRQLEQAKKRWLPEKQSINLQTEEKLSHLTQHLYYQKNYNYHHSTCLLTLTRSSVHPLSFV